MMEKKWITGNWYREIIRNIQTTVSNLRGKNHESSRFFREKISGFKFHGAPFSGNAKDLFIKSQAISPLHICIRQETQRITKVRSDPNTIHMASNNSM